MKNLICKKKKAGNFLALHLLLTVLLAIFLVGCGEEFTLRVTTDTDTEEVDEDSSDEVTASALNLEVIVEDETVTPTETKDADQTVTPTETEDAIDGNLSISAISIENDNYLYSEGYSNIEVKISYDKTLSNNQTLSITTGDEIGRNTLNNLSLETYYSLQNMPAATYPLRAVLKNADGSEVVSETKEVTVHLSPENVTPEAVTLTVEEDIKQTFKGFGVSEAYGYSTGSDFAELSSAQRTEIYSKLYGEMGLKFVRIWTRTAGDYDALLHNVIDTGTYNEIIKNGVTEILYAQLLFPSAYTTTVGSVTTLTNIDGYTAYLAAFLKRARDEAGITFTATGIINEPDNQSDHEVSLSDWPLLVISLRAALDAQGLTDVKIIANEGTGPGGVNLAALEAIVAVPEALAALDGAAAHSYATGENSAYVAVVKANNLDYWQTEAGAYDNEVENNFNYRQASTAAATALKDLNGMVTHWFWFIGINRPVVSQQDLLSWDADKLSSDENWIVPNYQYYSLKQLSTSFLPGTVMRNVTSSGDEDMQAKNIWDRRTPINAAAGIRPDNKWVIGIVNSTAYDDEKADHYSTETTATEYYITIDILELAGTGDKKFILKRTNRGVANSNISTAKLTNGQARFYMNPNELITLIEK